MLFLKNVSVLLKIKKHPRFFKHECFLYQN